MLVDAASYMSAMVAAIGKARKSILLLGWDFDPRVPLAPEIGGEVRFCDLIETVVSERPELSVHILIWSMTWFFAVQRRDRPQHAAQWLPKHQVYYQLDGIHPLGAAHHQKILVVDDAIGFCGGADFTRNRWDTTDHLPADRRRRTADGSFYGPRHEVVMAVDGEAAAALGELARKRWLRATGDQLEASPLCRTAWPDSLQPDLTDVMVGIARTEPGWRSGAEIREVERLNLSAIAAAERWIYLENQYVTAPLIAQALARRLEESNGPEVIIVCPAHSGGRFDRLTMDHARNHLVHRLQSADRYGRFRAFTAMADPSTPISIHSKVMIVDDRLLRIGSANLNNRSFGLDTECDLAVETEPGDGQTRKVIRLLLTRLLAEHTGSSIGRFASTIERTGSLRASIDAIANPAGRHLRPLDIKRLSALDRLMGRMHFFDPHSVADNWRPWRRL